MVMLAEVVKLASELSLADKVRLIEQIAPQIEQAVVAADHLLAQQPHLDASKGSEAMRAGPRILDLQPGAMQMSDDFDAPLPDEFWLGSDEDLT